MYALSLDWCWKGFMLHFFFCFLHKWVASLFGNHLQNVKISCTSIFLLVIDIPKDLASIWVSLNNTQLFNKKKTDQLVKKIVGKSEFFLLNDFMKTSKNNTSNLKSGGVNCEGYYNKYCSSCMSGKMSCKQCENGYSPMYDTTNSNIVQCANILTTGQYWWCGATTKIWLTQMGNAGVCYQCSSNYPYYYENNCHKCQQGYNFKNGICNQCNGCSTCYSNGCKEGTCLESFYGKQVWNNEQQYFEYQCIACGVGCSSCTSDGCLACNTGFYLKDGVCTTCPNTCSLCSTTSSECIQCQQNYVFQNPKTVE
ncbi:hypothetical protein EIN_357220 [Entamoeba invadens IP1]|uniref:Uncharacterized protein n=1 Tax=Entamoeba invadens IP1 TaxID=370355 RepID=L7FMH9_ENTIV|nr:hypothetical protein EIN_357220 [Entamoeba invadens IP1]ELP88919.1 hypothetical protein EIN_357220 [Entamoeba invadens IP1]|eukprot:XP_004255690.1 hypothetical protein EIN_357220 [Entamoeba invadens IP1]